jgi:outer membrane protein assembly factor BamE (lipoprotein component of BamABCDE complex)
MVGCLVGAVLIGVYVNEQKSDESRYESSSRYEPSTRYAPSQSYEPSTTSDVELPSVAAAVESAPEKSFTLGSTRDEVVAAQGTPTSVDKSMGETWWYQGARIEFRQGKVFEWHSSPFARLNAFLKPVNGFTAAAARDRGTFTLGASKDEVLALEGTPTAIDRSLGETWWYEGTRIEFRKGRVAEWHMSPMQRRLRVVLLPRDESVAATAKARDSYGPNATKDEVLGVEGTPTAIDLSLGETWWYGGARLEFRNGRIRDDSAGPMSPLHISMSAPDMADEAEATSPKLKHTRPRQQRIERSDVESSEPAQKRFFGVGSSSADVQAAQGKPQRVLEADAATEIWQYGSSTVTIRNGTVREYSNLGSLNIR